MMPVISLPLQCTPAPGARSKRLEQFWTVIETLFVNSPLQMSMKVRMAVLRLFGVKIGHGAGIRRTHIDCPWNLTIGEGSWIGEQTWFHCLDKVTIGANSVISQGTFITTGSHDIVETMDQTTKPVIIGDGVWITSKCIVLPGVHIGDSAVVLPGSVVSKSLAAGGVYGGSPAKFIRPRWADHAVEQS